VPTRQLRQGEHYGTTYARGNASGVVLSALRHAEARKLPVHEHEAAFFTMLLRGSYSERAGRAEFRYRPLTVVFHPPSLAHFDQIEAEESRLVSLEVAPRFFEEHDLVRPPLASQSMAASRLLLSLYAETRSREVTALEVESAAVELLAGASKTRAIDEQSMPRWLTRVIDRLHGEADGQTRLSDLARDAGIHPVHLTRVFRSRLGVTPGAYVQRLRLERAVAALANGSSLADAAQTAGFADQSHFCRAVRSQLGLTPRALNRLV
jgi:AraC family transcriptional regulator